ncbi:plexin-B1-like [Lytechinus pictus]|uniref:plexin-B1-like n=1 Tax=Lytechinus pictus TaxID=7653 RepID=UPI0030B9ED0C
MARNMKRAYVLYLGLIIFYSKSIQSAPLSSYLVSSFTPLDLDSNLRFNNIALNNVTGDIYIGARERLYQLDSNLNLKETVDAGRCPLRNENQYVNDNKLLIVVITPEYYMLITCGGCQAAHNCQTRNLTDISLGVMNLSNTGLLVEGGDLHTVGVVALGAEYESRGIDKLNESFYLFTGTSGSGGAESLFISKWNLPELQFEQAISSGYVNFHEAYTFKHLISYKDYIYYFVSRGVDTYLGRICRNSPDRDFESYTELELQCAHGGSQNVIQSAYIGPSGSQLAESMNISTADDLVYAVFSSVSSSSLCVYTMIDVQQRFEDAILGCILGTGTGTENMFLEGSICAEYPATPPDWYQCRGIFQDGYILYRYVSATNPLSASHIIIIPDVISTSIVTTIERHHTMAFIGDTEGSLHKV